MSALEQIKKKILDELVAKLMCLLGILSATLATFLKKIIPVTEIERIGALPWSILSFSLLAVCFLLASYIILQRPKYKFLQGLGVFVDKKSHQFICSSCKSKKFIQPFKISTGGYTCPICPFSVEHPTHEDIEAVKH
ncbi:MAG TPA: hypothetical protein VGJ93_07220, partial [Desulfuromonadaceae bacterium]